MHSSSARLFSAVLWCSLCVGGNAPALALAPASTATITVMLISNPTPLFRPSPDQCYMQGPRSPLGLPQSGSKPRSGPEPGQTGPRSGPRFGIVTEPDRQYKFMFGGMAEPSEPVWTGSEPPNWKVGSLEIGDRRPESALLAQGVNQARSHHTSHSLAWASLGLWLALV